MPVEAARKAPTTTMETARPPGRGPKTRAMVVSRSSAMRERSSVMPIITNMSTARSVSIDWPAITRSFMRFTMNDMVRVRASSHPPGKTGTSMRGSSGYRKTVIASRATPSARSAAYSVLAGSMAWWMRSPAESSAAMTAKERMPAPPMAKATGKPVMIPPKRNRKTMMIPISIPSSPNSMFQRSPWATRSRAAMSRGRDSVTSRSRYLFALPSPSRHSRKER